jgi:hypothetical protein
MPKLLNKCSNEELINEIRRRFKVEIKKETQLLQLERYKEDTRRKLRDERKKCHSCGILLGLQSDGTTEYIQGWENDYPYCEKNNCYNLKILKI